MLKETRDSAEPHCLDLSNRDESYPVQVSLSSEIDMSVKEDASDPTLGLQFSLMEKVVVGEEWKPIVV